MSKVKKFLLNVALQICAYLAMFAGGIPMMLGWPYNLRQLPHSSPEIIRNPNISIPPLPFFLKIVLLIICVTLLIIMMLRGNKHKRAVFNDFTRTHFSNFMLYYFILGALISLTTGLIFYIGFTQG